MSHKIGRAVQLHHKRYGAGRPLIILHGLFGSHRNWITVCEQLSSHFRVYALDLRNHGESPHSSDLGYSVMAKDVLAFMDRVNIDSAVVLGHSMGGKVAMAAASVYPERVRQLIVVDIAPKAYPVAYQGVIRALMDLDIGRFSRLKAVSEALAPAIPSMEIRYFILKNLAWNSDGRLYWKIGLDAIDANFERLQSGPRLRKPVYIETLFVRGDRSTFITDRDHIVIRDRFPLAIVRTVNEAGHWVHIDQPEAFVRMVGDFVRTG